MRFMLLTPGTGYFFCGSCLRDNTLAGALRRAGHEATVVPLYLPHVLEEEGPAREAPVQMGGINMYLQQKLRAARFLPRFLARLLDRPGLLRRVSRWGHMTDAHDLGAMTVSMLQGEHGRQRHEVDKLVEWVQGEARPDVIVISNALLCGVVRRLRAEVGVPIVVTLQGEAPFLDALPEPHRAAAWRELAAQAQLVEGFVPVSAWHGALMAERLGLDPARVRVIHNGIELHGFDAAPPLAARRPPVVGYLARMCRDKGLHLLVDAFIRLAARPDMPPDLRLRVVGAQLSEDEAFVVELQRTLAAAGLLQRTDFHRDVGRVEKLEHLRAFSVMSVPAGYGESFGLYLLEAMASGVPVVQPETAAFPEILGATGGGLLVAPDDAGALADGLASLLRDVPRAQALADAGRAAVRAGFVADRMAAEFADLCKILAPSSPAPPEPAEPPACPTTKTDERPMSG